MMDARICRNAILRYVDSERISEVRVAVQPSQALVAEEVTTEALQKVVAAEGRT